MKGFESLKVVLGFDFQDFTKQESIPLQKN